MFNWLRSLSRRKKSKVSVLLLVFVFMLSACGGESSSEAENHAPDKENTSETERKAVEIDNLGVKHVYAEPPKRVVTLNQHATEVMLKLGLEKTMVGTAYLDDEILPEYSEAYQQVPVLSDEYPSKEVFFAASPDFAYAGWKSAFTEKSLGTRDELEQAGIHTYVQQSSNMPSPTLEDVYADILNIGRIFQVEEKAQDVVEGMKEQLSEIKSKIGEVEKAPEVFVYDSGEEKAFTAANTYLTHLLDMIGAHNIFDDVDKGWVEVSWEEVVNRNPEFIVIMDYGNTTVEQKKQLLLSKPELADVPAIKNERFIVLPLSAAAEGIRAPIALQTLASGLYPER
ncbi:ABC transporter substrate-binding protein [Paenibacillus alkaliterrae]|uniref:ABC transporter substrate-binding protein n=1 Tax=Paenibacillus alkaliterrae TaxID=320909 RepID=UPI001F36CE95|nr:ABC transporter substrate-binding protein [Paenibacillus alkaliterrae]MCF2940329.1 ABC transporter substrate-binding protein [Paenibacillus alkaliterrae]